MTLACMYMYGVDGCTDGHAFTKISRIYSLPFFFTHGSLLKCTQTGGGLYSPTSLKIEFYHYISLAIFHEIWFSCWHGANADLLVTDLR